ncbi:MAG: aminopeptidase [Salinivirgaceae bacterium]|nr:MAG: aminopeptidase [Salinivirgaceae bacterium]
MRALICIVLLSFSLTVFSQNETFKVGGYELETIVDLPATPIKNQSRSGTCWSFSGLSFLESEILRLSDREVDLAEMWLVRHDYYERAIDYVRFQGNLSFGPGAESNDVMDMIKLYGIVPEKAYPGLNYGEKTHSHYEMDNVLDAIVKAVVENKNRKLSTAWKKAFSNVQDAYLGKVINSFQWQGKTYTPKEFAKELQIEPDKYVEISSFTHHPFYSEFIMEVPDNWAFGKVFNVKLDEFFQQAIYALDKGYTILWGSDVSEEGFSNRNAIALVPETAPEELAGSEKEKWEAMTEKERRERMFDFSEPVPEKEITQEVRQKAFDDYRTQDDHGMHIIGYAKDKSGKVFFKVKNTWGESNDKGGFFWASENYFKYKTLSIMIHQDAVMPEIKEKMK